MDSLIFISYSSADKVIADAITARLENQSIRCWIAPRDVRPGSDYSNQIADALERATAMVLVFSSSSNRSRHVKSEIDRAFSLGKIIVPFRVENIELDKGLAYYLAKTHWLDAVTKPLEQHIDVLASTLRQLSIQDASPGTPAPQLVAAQPAPPASQTKKLLVVGGVLALAALLGLGGFLFVSLRQNDGSARQSSSGASESTPERKLPAPTTAPVQAAQTPAARSANAAQLGPFEGAWTITEAETLNGVPYTGTVQITGDGDRFQVSWQTTTTSASGLGLAEGNKLCVGWSEAPFGVLVYNIGRSGTLRGRWILSAGDRGTTSGVETATGGPPGELAGRYAVQGSNPGGGNSYRGVLDITQTGATYQLNWNLGAQSVSGIGIVIDDCLFAAWSVQPSVAVVIYSFDNDRANGVWTLSGATQTAVEKLARQ